MKLVSFLDVVSISQANGRILEASAVSQEWLQRSGAHVKFWWTLKVSSTYNLHSHMNDVAKMMLPCFSAMELREGGEINFPTFQLLVTDIQFSHTRKKELSFS